MRTIALLLLVVVVLVCQPALSESSLPDLAAQTIAEDASARDTAIAKLRAAGPAGLAEMLAAYNADVDAHWKRAAMGFPCDPRWQRIATAIDRVAAQRDAAASRLYWYTDLDAAKRAAAEAHKPILSLRLLGRLDEEYSCANSRFFRTALYANKDVSRYLADHFVLHWQSVRPVPRITIDFGDGRKIERTITGNSIHYVLAADGRVIDALPGLYAPKMFVRTLEAAQNAAGNYAKSSQLASADQSLADFHRDRARAIETAWYGDLKAVNAAPRVQRSKAQESVFEPSDNPSASKAAVVAVGKGMVERPMLAAIMPDAAELTKATDDAAWQKIAQLHAADAALDASSVALMRAKQDPAAAMRRTMSKARVEDPLLRIVSNFQRSIAEDTVHNEYLLHRQLHEWLAANSLAHADVDALNEKVYADLFLTPRSDPWLGLVPADTYTALESGGLVAQRK